MARPIKTFTSDEAINIIRMLWLKSNSSDWYDFGKNLKDANSSIAAKESLDVTFQSNDKEAAPAALRAWIDTYLSPEGWKRIQAARRQKKSGIGNRDLLTKIDKESSWNFGYLAKAAGLTKKDYLSQLAGWMLNQDAGRKAAAAFAASLPAKRELLTK